MNSVVESVTVWQNIFIQSNFHIFRDTEQFHEYLTHKKLLSWMEFEQYRFKNESLSHKNQKSMKTRKLDTTKISCYTVVYSTRLQYYNLSDN